MTALPDEREENLTVPEVARIMRCSEWKVKKLIAGGALRASKPGRAWVVPRSSVQAHLDATSNQATARRRRRRAS